MIYLQQPCEFRSFGLQVRKLTFGDYMLKILALCFGASVPAFASTHLKNAAFDDSVQKELQNCVIPALKRFGYQNVSARAELTDRVFLAYDVLQNYPQGCTGFNPNRANRYHNGNTAPSCAEARRQDKFLPICLALEIVSSGLH